MTTTMDRAGRLVIPSDIRREASLKPGMPLEVRFHDGRIEIEAKAAEVKLVRRGRLLVAEPAQALPQLGAETVEHTRRELRRRHRVPR